MKKRILVLTTVLLAIGLSACGGGSKPAEIQTAESEAPYVEETAITFEYEVPSVEEFRSRIRRTLEKYPYIVAQRGEDILGYAYTGVFKGRAAYDWAVETTIYLDRTQRRTGLGRRLYQALEDISVSDPKQRPVP